MALDADTVHAVLAVHLGLLAAAVPEEEEEELIDRDYDDWTIKLIVSLISF